MSELLAPTVTEMIACAEREIRLRKHVYPRLVREVRMTQTTADRELEVMRAIHDWLMQQYIEGTGPSV